MRDPNEIFMKNVLIVVSDDPMMLHLQTLLSEQTEQLNVLPAVTTKADFDSVCDEQLPEIVVVDEESEIDLYEDVVPRVSADRTIVITRGDHTHILELINSEFTVVLKPISTKMLFAWFKFLEQRV
jgi:hypothetical protein